MSMQTFMEIHGLRPDYAFDAATKSPGTQLLEKMVSGAYQGALLLAFIRGAVLQKSGAGKSPRCPVCICAEGTTFHRSVLLGQKLTYFMTHFAQKQEKLYFGIVHGENTTISGTAIAGLTQK